MFEDVEMEINVERQVLRNLEPIDSIPASKQGNNTMNIHLIPIGWGWNLRLSSGTLNKPLNREFFLVSRFT